MLKKGSLKLPGDLILYLKDCNDWTALYITLETDESMPRTALEHDSHIPSQDSYNCVLCSLA